MTLRLALGLATLPARSQLPLNALSDRLGRKGGTQIDVTTLSSRCR